MPILGLLGVLFIGLKLTGYVAWSWLWVLAPFWVTPALLMVVFGLVGLCVCVIDRDGAK